MIQTLNNMAELRQTGFGHPKPRHGLQLLYWFANQFIDIDNDDQVVVKYHPKDGAFGFHDFKNRLECDNNICIKLLPVENYPYYEVGNLAHSESSSLPRDVRQNYTGHLDGSNKDRVIISLRQDLRVHKIFVTEHVDRSRFDPDHTYRISRGLLKTIRELSLDDFLKEAGYSTVKNPMKDSIGAGSIRPAHHIVHIPSNVSHNKQIPGFWETYCTIL